MYETHHHTFSTLDYQWSEQNVLFVKVAGFDAEKGEKFQGVIKFLNGMPFGDLIHPQNSVLSPTCRGHLKAYIINRYANKDFH